MKEVKMNKPGITCFLLNFQERVEPPPNKDSDPELLAYSKVVQFGTMTRTAIAIEGDDTDATECSLGVFPHPC
jgi:hypothetical protein